MHPLCARCRSNEDWGKSQFVYDRQTAVTLAAEVAALGGRVACISCPTLFRTLKARRACVSLAHVARPRSRRANALTCVCAAQLPRWRAGRPPGRGVPPAGV